MSGNNGKKYSSLIIIILLVISIGYAALNSTLNINGRSSISKNTWSVYFDNIKIMSDSVEAVKVPTITDNTTIDFEIQLNIPGDFYEFTVDVVNDGSIDAMIESINKTPNLTEVQSKYLKYTIEYENKEQLNVKQLVLNDSFVRLNVRVELRRDVLAIDLPTSIDTLNLCFNIDYLQADENGILVNNNGVWNVVADGSLYDIGTVVTIGSEKFYTIGTDGDNVKLLSMYNLYVGGSYNDTTKIWTAYGGEATGMQDSSMVGFVSNNIIRNGTTAFSSDLQKGKNYSTYSGSVVEKYVNNYKRLLEEKFDINIVEARLISKEELLFQSIPEAIQ